MYESVQRLKQAQMPGETARLAQLKWFFFPPLYENESEKRKKMAPPKAKKKKFCSCPLAAYRWKQRLLLLVPAFLVHFVVAVAPDARQSMAVAGSISRS
ncbi:hypothetical protein M441DRAFT_83578 [Trichoderma asperellum CBS 433.97]|uniref:Uncharacterized protein n=1 Tax=Trichoderma asperellum (strain ATCC 204424 / CBS 433.97 / NBRC 101777) TaxID=1042311 RepID=A0A2T3YWM9_TRIA4|nr:hypothetical protein M441DRAFT_83578 [Trichoderma asperellum CBS 433.97]PTB36965.1 hypothetical protein M441DRAFT_83578 [Trichoderma asperellum CBS 433.97]